MQVPKLRFKEFTNEWETKKIHDICDIVGGGTPSKNVEQYWNGNIAWISSSDIKENDIFNINITRYINEYAIKKSATKLCPKGTINIVSRVGVGKVAISPINLCTSQDFVNLINLTCNNIFLAYNLSIIMMEKSNQTQGTSIKGITIDEIKNITINLPSLEEQTKIANFLTLIDKKIELQTQLVDNLNLYKKGLLQKVFSNNSGWKNVKIGDILQYEQPNQYIVESTEYNDKFSIPVLTANKRFILGYTNENFGVYIKGECIIFDDFTMDFKFVNFPYKVKSSAIKILTTKNNNIRFIYQLLKTITLEPISHQRHYISVVQNIDIKIPSIEEQNQIAELFTNLDKKIDFETKKLENLKIYKKGLLQRIFI